MRRLTFHVKEVIDGIIHGIIFERNKQPRRDDFFVATGEVEFGGGYQDTGYFMDEAFEAAGKLFRFMCYPIGKYKMKTLALPEGVKLKKGQLIRVEWDGEDKLTFFKNVIPSLTGAPKIRVKKFDTNIVA